MFTCASDLRPITKITEPSVENISVNVHSTGVINRFMDTTLTPPSANEKLPILTLTKVLETVL